MSVCSEVVVKWWLLQPVPQVPSELVVEEQLASIGDTSEKDSQLVETCLRLGDASVSHCKTEKQGDQQPNALKSPLASHLQRSQLNQFANPTHMQEPKRNEIPSNVPECNLQNALLGCSTESRAQNHIDQRMPCLMPDWICDAGCDVTWTDDESETELQ